MADTKQIALDHANKREQWKKDRELEEARKAGTAPAERDEDGKEINPHIPQYIMKAPWYVSTNKPSLKHQRAFNKKTDYDENWYKRGQQNQIQQQPGAKYRKGACTNCGAMTHQAKDCCERPRKLGAKFTGQDIKPDENIQTLNLTYDAKRDPYNGYDPESYKDVVSLYEKADAARKKQRLQEIMKQHENSVNNGNESKKEGDEVDGENLLKEDEDKSYNMEDMAMHQKIDTKSRTTVRNLRIREDTAKYLYNLDLDSAFYEPKSRSMRENPLPNANITDIPFAGDNFTRSSGDTKGFGQMQMFSWEAGERGVDVDINAAPSQAAMMNREFLQKKEALKNKNREAMLSKYGGGEHLLKEKTSEDGVREIESMTVPQTEQFTEYNASGKLIKGVEKLVKSRYDEDVYLNNHTSVWGSYWESGQWGFQCCKQTIKNSYCTGESGRKLKENNKSGNHQGNHHNQTTNNSNEDDNQEPKSLLELNQNMGEKEKKELEKERKKKEKREEKEKEKKLKKAIKEQEEHNKRSVELDERKRGYNSLKGDNYEVSEQDMEAYNLKRMRADDPMANFKDQD